MNDPSHAVTLLIDDDAWNAEWLRGHPLVNTETRSLPRAGVETFLAHTGHVAQLVHVPVRAAGGSGA